ncbi:MAG: hypothetical protein AB9866_19120 [Syntrophobacteraceae bacterium]
MKTYPKKKLGNKIILRLEKFFRNLFMTIGIFTTILILSFYLLTHYAKQHDTHGTITGSLTDSILPARGYFEEDPEARTGDSADKAAKTGVFSAYTSRIEETDGDPYITADGTDLKQVFSCVVANNSLKMGSRIEVEGVGVCEVHDRKNARYSGEYFDLYFGNDVKRALEFGKKELKYTIL